MSDLVYRIGFAMRSLSWKGGGWVPRVSTVLGRVVFSEV